MEVDLWALFEILKRSAKVARSPTVVRCAAAADHHRTARTVRVARRTRPDFYCCQWSSTPTCRVSHLEKANRPTACPHFPP